jgi:hypothetical protein
MGENTAPAPPTVLLISYHFHPASEIGGRRTTALAQYLANKGLRVVVVSTFGGAAIEAGSEVLPGIIAVPVAQPRKVFIQAVLSLKPRSLPERGVPPESSSPAGLRGLLLQLRRRVRETFFQVVYFVDEHKKWGWLASRAATLAGRKYQARLLISSSPPFTALLTGRWAAWRLGIPHLADLRDPWTDSMAGKRPLQRLERWLLRILERWALGSAAAITSTGATLAELLSTRYHAARDRIHLVRNGYEGEVPRGPNVTGERLAILFAGELYVGRDPFPLLAALDKLLARPDVDPARVSVIFMGNAARYKGVSLAEWMAGKRCASVVKILPPSTPHDVAAAVAQATVLLNLAQEQPLSVPAKTYEHLASGREILLICERDSETASLVAGMTGVNQVDQRDPLALEQALLDLYRRHAVQGRMTPPIEGQVRRFSRAAANETFWPIINSLAKIGDHGQVDVEASSSP